MQALREEVVEDAYANLVKLIRRYADAPEGSAEARDALADVIEMVDASGNADLIEAADMEGGDEQ